MKVKKTHVHIRLVVEVDAEHNDETATDEAIELVREYGGGDINGITVVRSTVEVPE